MFTPALVFGSYDNCDDVCHNKDPQFYADDISETEDDFTSNERGCMCTCPIGYIWGLKVDEDGRVCMGNCHGAKDCCEPAMVCRELKGLENAKSMWKGDTCPEHRKTKYYCCNQDGML